MAHQVKKRAKGTTRISSKHQITIPVETLEGAGLRPGDRLRAEALGPGEVRFVREPDALAEYRGALTGVYARDELDRLRREWP